MQRQERILSWLMSVLATHSLELVPVSGDASFRRYFRVHVSNDEHYIVMDAPPQQEDCHPFVKVAELFTQAGVQVPQVLHRDLEQGFLLLTDFGDITYLGALHQDPSLAQGLYRQATDALVRIQQSSQAGVLPDYDRPLLQRELQLFPDWYVTRHLGVILNASQQHALHHLFARVLDNALAQPKVFVHRDYHSRNLMVTASGPGILDFQDAVYGPITYDAVSLFKDAYILWEEDQVLDWLIRYWEHARRAKLPVAKDFAEFYRDFEWMGLQRHLKVLGIFARLNYRDNKTAYLQHLPLVLGYVRRVAARYGELSALLSLLDEWHGANAQPAYGS